jgi:hypothetical protein
LAERAPGHGILEGVADRNTLLDLRTGAARTSSALDDESRVDAGEEIIEERSVILVAAYEPGATSGQRSPYRLVPELVDAGLTLTEDTQDSRKWAGVIDADTYARLAEAWGLENKYGEANLGMPGEHGDLASYSYTFDGLEWESGGSSPIVWMRLTVSEPLKRLRLRRSVVVLKSST